MCDFYLTRIARDLFGKELRELTADERYEALAKLEFMMIFQNYFNNQIVEWLNLILVY